jgi:hypothetical protein
MAAVSLFSLSLFLTAQWTIAAPNRYLEADAGSSASPPASPTPPPTRSHFTSESHGPYSGTPTTTGAVSASTILASTISPLPVDPTATTYPSDGLLHDPQPAPYVPNGGIGTNSTPVYNAKSDFDYESLVKLLL